MSILLTQHIERIEARVARLENLQQDPAAYKNQSERESLLSADKEHQREIIALSAEIHRLQEVINLLQKERSGLSESLRAVQRERDRWMCRAMKKTKKPVRKAKKNK